ncbi:coiled-coil domain-containing protein 24 [Synchiropus picturatus]
MNFLTDRGDCDISREFPIATEKFALGTEAAAFPHSHPMQSWDDSESTCPGPSLWSLIAEHAAESELPKIHAALGCSLVDMYTESHAEAVMWSNMWREKQQGSSRACTPLPDPPAIKELVRAEVQMLLQNLKTKVNGEGRCNSLMSDAAVPSQCSAVCKDMIRDTGLVEVGAGKRLKCEPLHALEEFWQ